jgi:hypothetical protein
MEIKILEREHESRYRRWICSRNEGNIGNDVQITSQIRTVRVTSCPNNLPSHVRSHDQGVVFVVKWSVVGMQ